MPESKANGWRSFYQHALRESDIEKLPERVGEAEAAIFERLQELAASSSHFAEAAELHEAADDLLAIKIRKLGYPDFRPAKNVT